MKNQTYWSNGVLREVVNGVLRREESRDACRLWHANGRLEMESTLVDGRPEGPVREWHDNGRLARESEYRNGRLNGLVRQWGRDGRLLGEFEMKDGRGIRKEWNEDGSLRAERENVADGSWVRTWDDQGEAQMTFVWDGEIVTRREFVEHFSRWSIRR